MSFLQGNTYLKPIQVLDDNGKVIKADKVVKGEFSIGDIYKYYGDGGDVQWNLQENAFIVPLTEEDTFSLKPDTTSEVQVRLLLDDGSVSGSLIEKHYVYRTKSKTRLTEGGAGEQSGELLQIKLLKELGTGGSGGSGEIIEETDPTVPQFVKDITKKDIENWNNKASKDDIPFVPTNISAFNNDAGYIKNIPSEYVTESELSNKGYATTSYVDGKVAELVNSAPEMLDTLGELAKAVEDNKDIIEGIKVPTKTSELTNDSGFVNKDYVDGLVGDINAQLENVLGV